jgi:hypothetical protein
MLADRSSDRYGMRCWVAWAVGERASGAADGSDLSQDRSRDRQQVAGGAWPDRQHGEIVAVLAPSYDEIEARAGVSAERAKDEFTFGIGVIARLERPLCPPQPVLAIAATQRRVGWPERSPPRRVHKPSCQSSGTDTVT